MKYFSALTILFFTLCPSQGAFINGQNYVSLADWARANGFRMVWQGRNGVVLTNRSSRLVFGTDSADAEINGVNVRLSFAVAKGPLISQLDLDTSVRPLISPQKLSARRITTICLDPGHGGKDTGNRVGYGFFAHNEKTYTLALALELRDQLKRAGFNVILTRSRDVYVDLPVRPALANRAGADLFVSLHFNSSPTDRKNVDGIETYCITPVGAASSNSQGEGRDYGAVPANRMEQKSFLLAYQMEKSLVQNLRAEDRDVRRARYAVLRDATMPAILIEGGYMSHPVEGKKIFSADYRKQMASAIVKGILNYQRLAAPPAPAVQPARANSIPATPKRLQ